MKVETINRGIQRSALFEEKTMGLAKGSEAFVFNVLRKDLYSDPIGSLIREYTVNAQDEHRKFNKTDVPILIQVPNQFCPELHIRDYAGGLTEEQVFEFFGNYGASDKRDSNDAVGFFGLGCKSAFAYTDSYIVKSYKDGKVLTFNIYIDETEIGKTAKIAEETTNEPNGLLIIVPVKTNDIHTFQQKIVNTIRYFKTKPIITGMSEKPDLEPRKALIKGDGWEFFGRGTPKVIMGEIPYPVEYYSMGNDLEHWENNLLESDLNIYVNIGDVQVTASREALQMSEKTIKMIREKLALIKNSMVVETEKTFEKAKNLIEAKALWNTLVNSGGYASIIRSHGIKWRGEELNDNVISFDYKLHRITTYQTVRSHIKTYESQYIACKEGETIYFDDTDKAQVGYKRRARTLLNSGDKRVIIIHTTDEKALEKLLGMSVKDLASYKAVTPTTASSSRTGGTGIDLTKRAKHTAKHFVLNMTKIKSYWSAASEVWEVKEVDTAVKGTYISIERFKPTGMHKIYDLDELKAMILHAEEAGIKIDVPIYGIKKGGDTTGLTRFDEWLAAKIKSNKKLLENYSIAKAYNNYGLIDVSGLNLAELPNNSIAKAYATLYGKARDLAQRNTFEVFRYSTVNVEANKAVEQLSNQFKVKYPLLQYIETYDYNNPEIVNYIVEKETY